MPQSIPPGLAEGHVLRALGDLDAGVGHPFGPPTGYELVHAGKRYAPKAVVGLACRHHLGRVLRPEEFTEDEAGTVRQSVPMSDDVAGVVRAQRQKFIDRFGREPGPSRRSGARRPRHAG